MSKRRDAHAGVRHQRQFVPVLLDALRQRRIEEQRKHAEKFVPEPGKGYVWPGEGR